MFPSNVDLVLRKEGEGTDDLEVISENPGLGIYKFEHEIFHNLPSVMSGKCGLESEFHSLPGRNS